MARRTGSRTKRWIVAQTRRALLRLDRDLPDWVRHVPVAVASAMAHLVVLLILALLLSTQPGGTRGPIQGRFEPLVETEAMDEAWDTLDSMPTEVEAIEQTPTEEVAVVEVEPSVTIEQDVAEPPPMDWDALGPQFSDSTNGVEVSSPSTTLPFASREAGARRALTLREGGTEESEEAVAAALDWLARHQEADGRWRLSYQDRCVDRSCSVRPSRLANDVAATGLSLLCFLGAGHKPDQPGPYQKSLEAGLSWLVRVQGEDGRFRYASGRGMFDNTMMYSHAIGTMAICEASGMSQSERFRPAGERAIRFIAQAQNTDDGGWRYTPGSPGDTSVFGWQIMALRSAHLADIPVPKNVLRGCTHYLDEAATDRFKITYAYLPGREATAVMTAEALLARQLLGWRRTDRRLNKGVGRISKDLLKTNLHAEKDIYYWYYATQLLHNMRDQRWDAWNPKIRDHLVRTQEQQGCARGSWSVADPSGETDRWGRVAGRLYVTTLSTLTLEVYYRYLPIYRIPEETEELFTEEE